SSIGRLLTGLFPSAILSTYLIAVSSFARSTGSTESPLPPDIFSAFPAAFLSWFPRNADRHRSGGAPDSVPSSAAYLPLCSSFVFQNGQPDSPVRKTHFILH